MAVEQTGIETFVSALEAPHSFADRLQVELNDCRIEVRSNRGAVTEQLGQYFAGFLARTDGEPAIRIDAIEAPMPELDLDFTVKQPDPGKTKIKEEYVDIPGGRIVRKRLTGMVFLFGDREHLAIGPCLENLNQVVNFVNNRYIQWCLDRGYLLCHAAAVSVDGRGLALAGLSGRGKSTLALALMSRGTAFVSNDRLLIRRTASGLEMVGVPKLPRVNPGTLLNNADLAAVMPADERRRVERLPADELWTLEQKYDVSIAECFGENRFDLRAEMTGLGILSWTRDADRLAIRAVDLNRRGDLLDAFTKSPGLFYLPQQIPGDVGFSTRDYLATMADCPVLEVGGGVDFEAAAETLHQILCRGDSCCSARNGR